MELIVVESIDSAFAFTELERLGVDGNGNYRDTVYAGMAYTLHLPASDPDSADVLSMSAVGEPFLLDRAPAAFSYVPTGMGNAIEGSFTWTPDSVHARPEPYSVAFRLDDGLFAIDLTVLFEVQERVEVASAVATVAEDMALQAIPNPSSGPVRLRVTLPEVQGLFLRVFRTDGRLVQEEVLMAAQPGVHDLLLPQLSPGAYIGVVEGQSAWRSVVFQVQ